MKEKFIVRNILESARKANSLKELVDTVKTHQDHSYFLKFNPLSSCNLNKISDNDWEYVARSDVHISICMGQY